jgi:plastocyanin
MKSAVAVVFFALSVAAVGCGDDSAKSRGGESAKPRAAGPSAGGGVGQIRGTVSLNGEPPVMREIPNHPCHPGARPLIEETVVADDQGRLANVVVFLREAPKLASGSPAPEPAVLDQVNCRYVPHVLALRTGQTLRVKTSDPALHNVHTMSSANPAQNFGMVSGAGPKDVTFEKPEEIAVRCDVHPWMNAKVHVFDHGVFTVTGRDGSFTLNDVPAGQYTLVFRHELFGDIEETIEVADKQTVTKDATYEKPGT